MTKPHTWTTKDGTVLRVSDMTDSHVLNTIRLARRTHRGRMLRLALSAGRYSATAPDGAAMAAQEAETEALDLMDDDSDEAVELGLPEVGPVFREAYRRNLIPRESRDSGTYRE